MQHARDRLVLSVYAEGELPIAADLTLQQLVDARKALRDFASRYEGKTLRVGRFETVAVRRNQL